jgi:fido (protein-threonine AMPylation protein)
MVQKRLCSVYGFPTGSTRTARALWVLLLMHKAGQGSGFSILSPASTWQAVEQSIALQVEASQADTRTTLARALCPLHSPATCSWCDLLALI